MVVDLPRWGPMLSPRVPNLVPIPGPRKERETPGQRPRPNYGHPHAGTTLPTAASPTSAATSISRSDRPRRPTPASPLQEAPPLAQHPSGGICQRCPAIPSTDRRQLGVSAHLALARWSTSPERSPAPREARACIGSLPAARGLLSPSAGVASAHQVRHLDEPAAGPAGQSHNRSPTANRSGHRISRRCRCRRLVERSRTIWRRRRGVRRLRVRRRRWRRG